MPTIMTQIHPEFIDYDECASEPCVNGATCSNEASQFSCSCAPGYVGVVCENGEANRWLHLVQG